NLRRLNQADLLLPLGLTISLKRHQILPVQASIKWLCTPPNVFPSSDGLSSEFVGFLNLQSPNIYLPFFDRFVTVIYRTALLFPRGEALVQLFYYSTHRLLLHWFRKAIHSVPALIPHLLLIEFVGVILYGLHPIFFL